MHLYLYVEGQTEQTFADTVLKPHLAGFGVYLMGAVLAEVGRRKGQVHRGGVLKYEPFRRGLHCLMKQHDRPNVAFSTMVDLNALPDEFPGWQDAEPLRHVPHQRVSALERALADNVGDHRLLPYIQLHEFEALLFADPGRLALHYPTQDAALASLHAVAERFASPELIDDGRATAPSKRIIAQLPDYEGAKTVVGPQVAQAIGLDVLRARCEHFSQWVARLEALSNPPQ